MNTNVLLHNLPCRAALGLISMVYLAGCTAAETPRASVRILDEVVHAAPERLGVNLGFSTYYGDQQYVENALLHGGFSKGMQTLMARVKSATENQFIDDTTDPADPWTIVARSLAGGSYEVATGARAGERGRITAHDSNAGAYTLEHDGPPMLEGDYVWLRGPLESFAQPEPPSTNGEERGLGIGDFRLWDEGGAVVDLVETAPGSTDQALRIALDPGEAGGVRHYIQATPDTSYRVILRARSAAAGTQLSVQMRNFGLPESDPTKELSLTPRGGATLTDSWREVIFEGRTGPDARIAGAISVFEIGAAAGDLAGVVEIDSARLEDGRLKGSTAFNRQVENALKEARVGTVRFYGVADLGALVEHFTARDQADAGWNFLGLGSGRSTGGVAAVVDDCLALAKNVGARPWLTIGGANTPEDWYALISYLAAPGDFDAASARRAAHGHAAPWTTQFDRIYLEIGNEWWNSIFRPFYVFEGAKYGEICARITARIQAHPHFDAEKLVIVAGGWAINAHGWNATVDAASAGHGRISLAPYVLHELDDFANNAEKYGTLFAAVDDYHQQIAPAIRAGLEANGKGTRLAIYELNTHLTGGKAPEAVASEIASSAAAGIAVLDQAMASMAGLGASPINYFTLLQRSYDGRTGLWGNLLREADGTLRARPVWHGLRLANEHLIEGDMIKAEVLSTPTWAQAENGNVGEIGQTPWLHAYAFGTTTEGGKRRTNVLLINRHWAEPIEAEVALPFDAGNSAQAVQLYGATPSSNNENSELVRPSTLSVAWAGATGTVLLPPCSATVVRLEER